MFCGYHVRVYSTITGPTDGVDRVEFSVWIFLHANTVLNFEKHNQFQNEGLNLVLYLALVPYNILAPPKCTQHDVSLLLLRPLALLLLVV